jgi:hypothetical protein
MTSSVEPKWLSKLKEKGLTNETTQNKKALHNKKEMVTRLNRKTRMGENL